MPTAYFLPTPETLLQAPPILLAILALNSNTGSKFKLWGIRVITTVSNGSMLITPPIATTGDKPASAKATPMTTAISYTYVVSPWTPPQRLLVGGTPETAKDGCSDDRHYGIRSGWEGNTFQL